MRWIHRRPHFGWMADDHDDHDAPSVVLTLISALLFALSAFTFTLLLWLIREAVVAWLKR